MVRQDVFRVEFVARLAESVERVPLGEPRAHALGPLVVVLGEFELGPVLKALVRRHKVLEHGVKRLEPLSDDAAHGLVGRRQVQDDADP